MSPHDTQNEFFHRKLSGTAVPDWREGWERLEPRLPEGRPSLRRRNARRNGALLAAAALALLLGLGMWWLGPAGPQPVSGPQLSRISAPQPPPETPLTTGRIPAAQDPFSPSAVPLKSLPAAPTPVGGDLTTPGSGTGVSSYALPRLSGVGFRAGKRPVPQPDLGPRLEESAPRAAAPETSSIVSVEPPSPKPESPQPSRWHFALRLNANGGSSFGAGPANANPLFKGTPVDLYPSAYVGKSLSHKVSLQLGLAVASPVDVRNEGLNRSIPNPMRAMAMGVSESQDSINFSRLYYADIPLTLQYHLSERFTVGSGLQISVLEKAIGRKQQLDYNADGLLQQRVPESPRFENIAHDQAASGMINPIDLRMVLGLHYRLGEHWNLSVQYQYGLTDISSNRAFLHHHVNRNQVFQTAIGFRLK